jgi:hypothetical protein
LRNILKAAWIRTDFSPMDGIFLDVLPVPVVGGFVKFGVDVPHHLKLLGVEQCAGVYLPLGIVPDDPFFPGGDIPDIRAILSDQPFRVGRVGELEQSLLKLVNPQIDRLVANGLNPSAVL